MKPFRYWGLFAICLAVLLAAMGWISAVALRLDRSRAEAWRKASFEENVRLALWRMESTLVPMLARESARPYFVYSPFYSAERAYTRMFEEMAPSDILVPSPLLTESIPGVLLHFQIDPQQHLTSPKVPRGQVRQLADATFSNALQVSAAETRLREFELGLDISGLRAAMPLETPRVEHPAIRMAADETGEQGAPQAAVNAERDLYAQQMVKGKEEFNARSSVQWRAMQNSAMDSEYKAPSRIAQKVATKAGSAAPPTKTTVAAAEVASTPLPAPAPAVREGVMRPLWSRDRLILARRVSVAGRDYVQGCWLDWPLLKSEMLAGISDLLPAADLRPSIHPTAEDEGRTLAGLPAVLLPGDDGAVPFSGSNPVLFALGLAWTGVLLGAGAVGALLAGAMALSERRGAFVSAVTHEMRTPLTTFRMYSEMLVDGMVPEEKRNQYLTTLCAEGNRLTHLVENVLAYSRLERGRHGGHVEELSVRELLNRPTERLSHRAGQAGMTLRVEFSEETGDHTLRADAGAVEQILFNLVDNACKYAAAGVEKTLAIGAVLDSKRLTIRVQDHGPGILPRDARRLFQPFSKSAQHAAESAPGVGLGLALSRRLARQLGGDLRLVSGTSSGACFELTLPLETRMTA